MTFISADREIEVDLTYTKKPISSLNISNRNKYRVLFRLPQSDSSTTRFEILHVSQSIIVAIYSKSINWKF